MSNRIPFELVSTACQKTNTSAVLIGGQAVGARGYQRMTLDVDFMVTEESYEKVKPVICLQGYRELVRTNVAAKLRSEKEDRVDIDFMFVDDGTFEGIKKQSSEEDYEGSKLLVPTAEHLIALKLHAIKQQPDRREYKDLNDIVELIRANKINVNSDVFKKMTLKFGTEALYEKIKSCGVDGE